MSIKHVDNRETLLLVVMHIFYFDIIIEGSDINLFLLCFDVIIAINVNAFLPAACEASYLALCS